MSHKRPETVCFAGQVTLPGKPCPAAHVWLGSCHIDLILLQSRPFHHPSQGLVTRKCVCILVTVGVSVCICICICVCVCQCRYVCACRHMCVYMCACDYFMDACTPHLDDICVKAEVASTFPLFTRRDPQ